MHRISLLANIIITMPFLIKLVNKPKRGGKKCIAALFTFLS